MYGFDHPPKKIQERTRQLAKKPLAKKWGQNCMFLNYNDKPEEHQQLFYLPLSSKDRSHLHPKYSPNNSTGIVKENLIIKKQKPAPIPLQPGLTSFIIFIIWLSSVLLTAFHGAHCHQSYYQCSHLRHQRWSRRLVKSLPRHPLA